MRSASKLFGSPPVLHNPTVCGVVPQSPPP
jgi:hypothetical protein